MFFKKNNRPVKEWKADKRWNPFNSYKLLAHVDRWRQIQRGKPVPPPALVTVDPTNVCNLNCEWCNAAFVRQNRRTALAEKTLHDIADFLPQWGMKHFPQEWGVKAVCIAGGGEPLLNPAIGSFIERLADNHLDIGIVTNGTMLDRYQQALGRSVWVGVSVDSATRRTFNRLKGLPESSPQFDQVIDNIARLADFAKQNDCTLGKDHPAYGVSYKYLLYKNNISEIYQAAKLAKQIGCKNIHFRPASTTWNQLGKQEIIFSRSEVRTFRRQIEKALTLDDDNFGVYGVTHKFNSQFGRSNRFTCCHAVFMTAVFMPAQIAGAKEEAFTLGLCCDRRGDERLELGQDLLDVAQVESLWGSEDHWALHDRIQIEKDCPRCTYQPHNEIYEQVILNDSMTYKFI